MALVPEIAAEVVRERVAEMEVLMDLIHIAAYTNVTTNSI